MPDETARFFNPTTAQFVNSGNYSVDRNLRLKDSKLLAAPTIARWMDGEILSETVLPAPSSVTPLDEVDLLAGATAEVEKEREVITELKKVSATEQVEHVNPMEQTTSVEHAKSELAEQETGGAHQTAGTTHANGEGRNHGEGRRTHRRADRAYCYGGADAE